jgi:hypothetical protein
MLHLDWVRRRKKEVRRTERRTRRAARGRRRRKEEGGRRKGGRKRAKWKLQGTGGRPKDREAEFEKKKINLVHILRTFHLPTRT